MRIIDDDGKRIEANTVTLMVPEEPDQKSVGVYLLDAATGVELANPLTVEVAFSM